MIVAAWSAVRALMLAVKVALLEPEAMTRDGGTVMLVVLELRITMVPPLPAPLRCTVQTVELPAFKARGLHVMPLTVVREAPLTDPPVAEIATASPIAEAPMALVTATAAADAAGMDTVATIPFAIVLVFVPDAMHTNALALPAQVRVLPADDNTGPATTLRLVTVPAG